MLLRVEGFYASMAAASGAPMVLGTPTTYDRAAANPQNLSYTLPSSAADRLVVAIYDDNTVTVSSITWTATGAGGQSLTPPRKEPPGGGQTSVELWDLEAPNFGTAAGAGTISVTRSGSEPMGAIVYALDGAVTGAPIVSGQNGVSTANPAALAIDPDPNSIILDLVCGGSNGVSMTFAEPTEDFDADIQSTVMRAGAARKTVASGDATTVDVSFSATMNRYAQIAAAYAAGAGAPPSTPTFDQYAIEFSDLGGSSKTVTISGVAGDLWIGFVVMNDSKTINDPAGWSAAIVDISHAGNANFKMKVWWRMLSGSMSDPAFTISSAGDEWAPGVIAFTGANASAPINVITTDNTATTASPTCPDATTTADNCRVLRLVHGGSHVATQDSNYPVGTTGVFARDLLSAENAQCAAVAHAEKASAGAAGTAQFSGLMGASGRILAVTIGIKP